MGLLATPTTITPAELAVANNIRVVSMSIAAYDYILTIPWEYRLYRSSDKGRLGLILFVLVRYISATLIIVSNVGFFYHGFSRESCGHYFYVTPIFKLLQMMVTQAILGVRAYNIAQRNVWVRRTILLAYFIVVGFQWVTALSNQKPVTANGNCMVSNAHQNLIASIWTFYVVAVPYDCLVLLISTVYLFRMRTTKASAASELVRMLLYDGMGYFVIVTAANVTNIIINRGSWHSVQTAVRVLGSAITWIMCQRILIHPRQVRAEQKPVAQPLTPPVAPPSTVKRFSGEAMGENTVNSPGLQDVLIDTKGSDYLQVHIERSIMINTEAEDGKIGENS